MRAVLDTNVALAGLLWRGTPYALLGLALTGKLECFATDALLAELERVLGYERVAKRIAALNTSIAELLADYRALVEIVPDATISPTVITDPDDDALLACAIAAQADLIVSGDADLLNLKHFHRIPIVNATEALARIAPHGSPATGN